jgi:DNA-binding transcriptional LysR family regulator
MTPQEQDVTDALLSLSVAELRLLHRLHEAHGELHVRVRTPESGEVASLRQRGRVTRRGIKLLPTEQGAQLLEPAHSLLASYAALEGYADISRYAIEKG